MSEQEHTSHDNRVIDWPDITVLDRESDNSTTPCLKKVLTFKLSVTLSNLNKFSKFFALLKSVCNLLQNPYDITHLTLGMLLHYLRKLEIQIFCRYSAHTEENANKLHFECTNEYPSPVISHGQSYGSAACPLDSRLNH